MLRIRQPAIEPIQVTPRNYQSDGLFVMARDTGTANAVQGFVSDETVVSKNVTALPTTFLFQLLEYIQFPYASITATKIWLKVSGVWKETIPWIRVSGVWKQSTPYIKVGGTWK